MTNIWDIKSSVPPTLLALGVVLAIIIFIAVAVLKGFALWYSARRGEKAWFIALLIVNSLGILELIYLFAIAKWGKAVKASNETGSVPPPSQNM